jgi:glucose/arabinose dehydrogenase
MFRGLCSLAVSLTFAAAAIAEPPTEADFYRLTTFTVPKDVSLEVGATELLPDGKLAVSTRRGEIWLVDQPFGAPEAMKWTRFAHGLHEVLGLAHRDGWLYLTQRGDVSRIRDTDGDGTADQFEVVNDDWQITGDYHEYAFGSKFDKDGNIWVTLCLTGSFGSDCKYRGWCLRITPDGKSIPTCSGIRSPGGIGFNATGDVFYTDNQGPWNGTCALKHLVPGKFVGHPGGFKWYDLPEVQAALGKKPQEPESGSRFMTEAKKIPEYEPPVILFPYKKMGQSASGVACDTSGGKFGPFQNQMFVGDQTNSTVMRCFLEQVDGHYQGACFPFREGFSSGTLSVEFAGGGGKLKEESGKPENSLSLSSGSPLSTLRTPHSTAMFVGGTNRGWGSRGNKPFALERLDWTGKTPFEIHELRAKPDGFELRFTEPVNREAAGDVEAYKLQTYTYIFQSAYGSPEVDFTTPTIKSATVSEDGQSVRLMVDGLQEGHIHELVSSGVKSATGLPLLHPEAYYTLNRIPKE